jgi:hypothetical protein
MERGLRIFEMDEAADPVALARSRLVHDRLPREYAATRARCAINLKAVKNSNDDIWSFVILPDGLLVSGLFPLSLISSSCATATLTFRPSQQRVAVNAARSDPPTPRAQTCARRSGGNMSGRRVRRSGGSGAGSREMKNFGCESSRDSPPVTSEYSSSRDEEESDGGQAPPERWEPVPPSPRAAEAAEEQAPGEGAGAPAVGRPTEEAVHAAEVPARAAEAPARVTTCPGKYRTTA